MKKNTQPSEKSLIQTLKNVPLFKGLIEEKSYQDVLRICTHVTFLPRESLVEQHKPTDFAYVIIKGTAHVYRTSTDKVKSTLALLGKGDIVGELSLLDGGVPSASVEAIDIVHALKIQHSDFSLLLTGCNTVSLEMIQVLVRRLRRAGKITEEIRGTKLSARTLSVIRSLSLLRRSKTILVSQAELARLVSASRPRITMALQELENEGKISRKWRSITLL